MLVKSILSGRGGSLLPALGVVLLAVGALGPAGAAKKPAGVRVVAGSGRAGYSGDQGPAVRARLNHPVSVAVDRSGNTLIADTNNHVIRLVDRKGRIRTVAGTGQPGYSGDQGPAVRAQLREPAAVLPDRRGNLYIADTGNACVRRVDSHGRITTVAGTGRPGSSADGGPADESPLVAPVALALDSDDNLYIADLGDNRLRRVDADKGVITTLAGTGRRASDGDGNPARQASLDECWAVAVDSDDNVYLCDGNRVRKIDRETGIIGTVAGKREAGYSGDGGSPLAAAFSRPSGLYIDGDDNLLIADTGNHCIRRLDRRKGILSTVAGTGRPGEGEEGRPSLETALNAPQGIWLRQERLLIADSGNHRVLMAPLPRSR